MGKTIELGGPHIYTMEELYELMQEIVNFPCVFVKPPEPIKNLLAKVLRSRFFNFERYTKEGIDQVVNTDGSVMTFQDLGIEPASAAIRLRTLLEYKRRAYHRKNDEFV